MMFEYFEQVMVSVFGSLLITAFVLIFVQSMIFLIGGLDLRIMALIICIPIGAYASSGWFPLWVSAIVWVIIIPIIAMQVYNMFTQ